MLSNQSSRDLAKRNDLHLKRKLWHVTTGLIALAITFALKLDSKEAALISFIVGASGLIFEGLRLKFSSLNQFFISLAGNVLREREKHHISGFTFYCLGVSGCFFFFPWDYALISVLFLIFADPAASIIGITFGRTKTFLGKSLEGSLGCFFVCAGICLLYGSPEPEVSLLSFALLGGFSGAVSELLAFLDDNLTIPLMSGFFLSKGMALLL